MKNTWQVSSVECRVSSDRGNREASGFHSPFAIRHSPFGTRSHRCTGGQAIVEYLLVTAAVIAAIVGITNAVGWKTLAITVREVNRVNAIPRQ